MKIITHWQGKINGTLYKNLSNMGVGHLLFLDIAWAHYSSKWKMHLAYLQWLWEVPSSPSRHFKALLCKSYHEHFHAYYQVCTYCLGRIDSLKTMNEGHWQLNKLQMNSTPSLPHRAGLRAISLVSLNRAPCLNEICRGTNRELWNHFWTILIQVIRTRIIALY